MINSKAKKLLIFLKILLVIISFIKFCSWWTLCYQRLFDVSFLTSWRFQLTLQISRKLSQNICPNLGNMRPDRKRGLMLWQVLLYGSIGLFCIWLNLWGSLTTIPKTCCSIVVCRISKLISSKTEPERNLLMPWVFKAQLRQPKLATFHGVPFPS